MSGASHEGCRETGALTTRVTEALSTNLGTLCVEAVLLQPALDVFGGKRDCFLRHQLHEHLKEAVAQQQRQQHHVYHRWSLRPSLRDTSRVIQHHLSSVPCQLGALIRERLQASHDKGDRQQRPMVSCAFAFCPLQTWTTATTPSPPTNTKHGPGTLCSNQKYKMLLMLEWQCLAGPRLANQRYDEHSLKPRKRRPNNVLAQYRNTHDPPPPNTVRAYMCTFVDRRLLGRRTYHTFGEECLRPSSKMAATKDAFTLSGSSLAYRHTGQGSW